MTSSAPCRSETSECGEDAAKLSASLGQQDVSSAADPAVKIASIGLSTIGIWLLSAILVAWFEFGIFWNLPLLLFAMNLNFFDQLLVVGSLLARTLIVTSPLLIALLIATKRQWDWKWKAVAWMGHFGILAWIVVDCGLQCVTGANIWHYAQKAMTTEDLSVGGDVSLLLAGIKSALSVIALQIAAISIGVKVIVQLLRESGWQKTLPVATNVSKLSIVALILSVVGARQFVTQRPALEQLYGTMTLRTWLFHPDRIAQYGEAAFGRECESDFEDLQPNLSALFDRDVCRPKSIKSTKRPDHRQRTSFVLTRNHQGSDCKTDIDRPNIVLLLTESIRHDALTEEQMPRLFRTSKTGLVARQHTTNSNCSEFGAFTALYGQYALCYDDVLDNQVPSVPMTELHQLGYHRQMVNSCSVKFSRMNEFLSDLNFDRVSIHNETGNPWHDNDRQTLREIVDIVHTNDEPQFVFSILMATHYSYDYPEEYDHHPPNSRPQPTSDAASHEILEDRYWKSVSFLDEQISNLIDAVKDTNTIVIVTGDHGESFLDDGFLCHGTRLSKIQTQTPLLIVGPGVSVSQLDAASGHIDLMPTILDLATGSGFPHISQCPGPGRSVFDVLREASSLDEKKSANINRSQLVLQARVNDWEIALLHPEGTLAFQTSRSGEGLKIAGFLNETGRVDQSKKRGPREIPLWKTRLKESLTAPFVGAPWSQQVAGMID